MGLKFNPKSPSFKLVVLASLLVGMCWCNMGGNPVVSPSKLDVGHGHVPTLFTCYRLFDRNPCNLYMNVLYIQRKSLGCWRCKTVCTAFFSMLCKIDLNLIHFWMEQQFAATKIILSGLPSQFSHPDSLRGWNLSYPDPAPYDPRTTCPKMWFYIFPTSSFDFYHTLW